MEQRSPEALERRRKRRAEKQRQGLCNHTKQKWIDANPEKRKCHNTLNNAVRDGKIDKPTECPKCRRTVRLMGHHHDYTKPLEVEWMCGKCHYEHHQTE